MKRWDTIEVVFQQGSCSLWSVVPVVAGRSPGTFSLRDDHAIELLSFVAVHESDHPFAVGA